MEVSISGRSDHRPEVVEVFKRFDINGDGKIPPSELLEILRLLKDILTETEMEETTEDALDAFWNGDIDLHKFITLNSKRYPVSSSKTGADDEEVDALRSVFNVFDFDKDEFISAVELQQVLFVLGHDFSMDVCRNIISIVDADEDQLIDIEEFQSARGLLTLYKPGGVCLKEQIEPKKLLTLKPFRGIKMRTRAGRPFGCPTLVAGFVACLPLVGASSASASGSSTSGKPSFYQIMFLVSVGAGVFAVILTFIFGCLGIWRGRGDDVRGVVKELTHPLGERLGGTYMTVKSVKVGKAKVKGITYDSRPFPAYGAVHEPSPVYEPSPV